MKLLETAWSHTATGRYPTILSRVDSKAFRLFRDVGDYLIKIHGTIDEPQSIVFDRTSYQRSAFSNQFYGDFLSTLLLTHTIVFIGFSMNDPAVSLIVESSAYRYPESRPHYIFQSGEAIREVDELWKKLRKMYVVRYSERNRHIALAGNLEALATQSGLRRGELLAADIAARPSAT